MPLLNLRIAVAISISYILSPCLGYRTCEPVAFCETDDVALDLAGIISVTVETCSMSDISRILEWIGSSWPSEKATGGFVLVPGRLGPLCFVERCYLLDICPICIPNVLSRVDRHPHGFPWQVPIDSSLISFLVT